MSHPSSRYMPEHIFNPAAFSQRAQPPSATSPSYGSASTTAPPTMRNYRSGRNKPSHVRFSDLEADPAYTGHNLPHRTAPAGGYPYLPHNPTPTELEACNRRMSNVRLRHASESRSRFGSGDVPLGDATRCNSIPSNHLLPPELVNEIDLSDNVSTGESSGPDTPYSPTFNSPPSRDAASLAFVPQEFQSSSNSTPPTSPATASDEPAHGNGTTCSFDLPSRHISFDPSYADSSANRASVCSTIEEIIYELNSRVLNFKMPDHLELATPGDGESLPRLPYTGRNRPLIDHKHKLDSLWDRLDKIESDGDQGIRDMRKQAVEEVRKSLEELDRQQSMAWFNYQYEQKRERTA
ncbi:hypothetical protein FRC12_023954 [Ceratobasidium sp. 428]|nr:hypothetical protein FRC12_023954 [Ceratobasidium sp. 428]